MAKDRWRVMAEKCGECLFSPNAIVSPTRRQDLLKSCREEGRPFECHKATIAGKKITCRGFYDQPDVALPELAKVAKMIEQVDPGSVVEFVPESELKE